MKRVEIRVMDVTDLFFSEFIISAEMGNPYWVDKAKNLASLPIRKLLGDGWEYWLIVDLI